MFVGLVVFPLALAAIMGIPTLRLRADYLAIVTIAAAEMFRIVARSPTFDKWTGSSDGLGEFADTFYELSPFERGDRYFFEVGRDEVRVRADGDATVNVGDQSLALKAGEWTSI